MLSKEQILKDEAMARDRRRAAANALKSQVTSRSSDSAVFSTSVISQQKIQIEQLERERNDLLSRSIIDLPSELIEVTDFANRNERFLFTEDFFNLIDSISESGQQIPIQIRTNPDHDSVFKYQLISGRRRLEACRFLNIKVKASLVEADDVRLLELQLIENIRSDLNCFEEARSVHLLKQKGSFKSDAQLAQTLGFSKAKLSLLFKILRIPSVIVDNILTHSLVVGTRTYDGVFKDVLNNETVSLREAIYLTDYWEQLPHITQNEIISEIDDKSSVFNSAHSLSEKVQHLKSFAKKTKTASPTLPKLKRDISFNGKQIGRIQTTMNKTDIVLKFSLPEEEINKLEEMLLEKYGKYI